MVVVVVLVIVVAVVVVVTVAVVVDVVNAEVPAVVGAILLDGALLVLAIGVEVLTTAVVEFAVMLPGVAFVVEKPASEVAI